MWRVQVGLGVEAVVARPIQINREQRLDREGHSGGVEINKDADKELGLGVKDSGVMGPKAGPRQAR